MFKLTKIIVMFMALSLSGGAWADGSNTSPKYVKIGEMVIKFKQDFTAFNSPENVVDNQICLSGTITGKGPLTNVIDGIVKNCHVTDNVIILSEGGALIETDWTQYWDDTDGNSYRFIAKGHAILPLAALIKFSTGQDLLDGDAYGFHVGRFYTTNPDFSQLNNKTLLMEEVFGEFDQDLNLIGHYNLIIVDEDRNLFSDDDSD